MNKLSLLIAIATALVEFSKNPDVTSAFKALVDLFNQWKQQPKVGAAPVSAADEQNALDELKKLGVSEAVAKDALSS